MGEAKRLREQGVQFKQMQPGQQIQVDLKNATQRACACGCKHFIPVVAVYTVDEVIGKGEKTKRYEEKMNAVKRVRANPYYQPFNEIIKTTKFNDTGSICMSPGFVRNLNPAFLSYRSIGNLVFDTVVFKWAGQLYLSTKEFEAMNHATKRKIAAAKAMRTMKVRSNP